MLLSQCQIHGRPRCAILSVARRERIILRALPRGLWFRNPTLPGPEPGARAGPPGRFRALRASRASIELVYPRILAGAARHEKLSGAIPRFDGNTEEPPTLRRTGFRPDGDDPGCPSGAECFGHGSVLSDLLQVQPRWKQDRAAARIGVLARLTWCHPDGVDRFPTIVTQ